MKIQITAHNENTDNCTQVTEMVPQVVTKMVPQPYMGQRTITVDRTIQVMMPDCTYAHMQRYQLDQLPVYVQPRLNLQEII